MTATDTKALLPKSAQHAADHPRTLGYEKNIVMLPATGKTSTEAAAGLGRSVTEIAKSIIFRRVEDDVSVLMIASGTNRVNEAKISIHVSALAKADAKFVHEKTRYAIGGACPISHAVKPVMLPDQDLFQYDNLWAAAGHPHAVFNLTPAELEVMTGTPMADIAQRD